MSAARGDSQELLGGAQETVPDMLEDEQALRLVRQRFERTEDPQLQGELAAEALDYIEHQLQLTRERRRQLEGVEGKLWARRNRLERFLIHTRGKLPGGARGAIWDGRKRLAGSREGLLRHDFCYLVRAVTVARV